MPAALFIIDISLDVLYLIDRIQIVRINQLIPQ